MYQIQGAIMLSALFQIVIGFTGLTGVLLRFIGPLTIAPTITLIGVGQFNVAAERAGFSYLVIFSIRVGYCL